jgi:hypothetical protein
MIQFVMKTGRFQPRATIAGGVEEVMEDGGERDVSGIEQEMEESDDGGAMLT